MNRDGALLDAAAVARRLNVSRSTAYRLMRSRMQHVVLGERVIRVTEEALLDFIAASSQEPSCPSISTGRSGPASPTARGLAGTTRSTACGSPPTSAQSTRLTPELGSGNLPGRRKLQVIQPRTKPRGG